ncbi:hypothetical protein BpHYR1_017190 [Brachionus plicatilis]|uniref:Uncharacterized protein n=1 Tax=Brachionus plicatilis TaxID=10195 RepID=A0A3M7QIQ1_BRAPC|nr:hypothetical protein BpHYR1_017190 [Brachionus plicatilis]
MSFSKKYGIIDEHNHFLYAFLLNSKKDYKKKYFSNVFLNPGKNHLIMKFNATLNWESGFVVSKNGQWHGKNYFSNLIHFYIL